MTSALNIALEYAARGWPVFPCRPDTKQPLTPQGFKNASTDEAQIRTWWRRWPTAMIAIPTGPASGFWALDLDSAEAAEAVFTLGDLPATLRQNTPHGQHLLFAWDDARPIKNTQSKIARRADTRGAGGYVIMAGSARADGSVYAWRDDSGPEPVRAPDWLFDILLADPDPEPVSIVASSRGQNVVSLDRQRAAYVQAALDGEVAAVASAPRGQRNAQLNTSALKLGHYVGSGVLSQEEVASALYDAAVASGLVKEDGAGAARATIRSGLNKGVSEPKTPPERPTPEPIILKPRAQVQYDLETGELVQEAEAGSQGLFRVTHYADIGDEHQKTWLIDDLFGAGELSVIYGAPGCGKSVLAGDMAAHVAAGLPWFERPVKEGVVVYIAAERAGLVKRRLAAWRKRHGVLDIPLLVVEGGFDLCRDTSHATEIARIAGEAAGRYSQQVAWVIIDTKAQVMAGADPNSDKDTGALIRSAGLIQQATGAHVTIIDHVPLVSPDRMKGSGALGGASDGSYRVFKDGDVRRLTIGSKPPNDGPDELDIAFNLESEVLGTSPDGKETTAPVVVRANVPRSEEAPRRNSKRKNLPNSAQKVRTAFGRLVEEGKTSLAPLVPGVRDGTRAVTLADLREKAFEVGFGQVPPGPDADLKEWMRFNHARNTAFGRGLEALEQEGMLRTENGFAWEPRGNLSGVFED